MEKLEILGIVAIPVITVICFLIAEAVKATELDNKWLPIICGVCGGILGVVALKVMPEFPAVDVLTAIAIGIVSGLGATGAHQVYKQLTDIWLLHGREPLALRLVSQRYGLSSKVFLNTTIRGTI